MTIEPIPNPGFRSQAARLVETASRRNDSNTKYASASQRMKAGLIDGCLLAGWLVLAASVVRATGGGVILAACVPLLLSVFYFACFEGSRFKASLGKRWLGLRVVDSQGKRLSWKDAALRVFLSIPTALTLGALLAITGKDRKRRALHDRIVGSLVLVKNQAEARPDWSRKTTLYAGAASICLCACLTALHGVTSSQASEYGEKGWRETLLARSIMGRSLATDAESATHSVRPLLERIVQEQKQVGRLPGRLPEDLVKVLQLPSSVAYMRYDGHTGTIFIGFKREGRKATIGLYPNFVNGSIASWGCGVIGLEQDEFPSLCAAL